MYTLITAHSGCDCTADNSLEYLNHAIKTGADAFEVDVHRNCSGSFYLSHDTSGDSCPDLLTAFELVKGSNKLINCDLKTDDTELEVLSIAQKSGVSDQLLFSGSVSLTAIRENDFVRNHTLFNITPILPDVIAHYRRGVLPTEAQWREVIRICQEYKIRILNIPFELCTDDVIEKLHSNHIMISAWTVNDEVIARRLLQHDVYNITTRHTDLLCSLRFIRKSTKWEAHAKITSSR